MSDEQQQQMRADAAEMVGGDDELKGLLGSARQFVPADEMERFNARLADPSSYRDALADLLSRKDAANRASSGPKNLAEYNRLAQRATNGDATAAAIVKATDPSRFH